MLPWCRERPQTDICCFEWFGRLKCLATGLDVFFSSFSTSRRCSRNRSPSRLPVSPIYNFLQRVQVIQVIQVVNWPVLETLRKIHKCILVYKCLRNFVPIYLKNYFKVNNDAHMWNIYEIIHICTAVVDESEVWSSQWIFQFKQLERRSLKKIRASTGFEPMTSAIPVRYSTNWAMKPHIGSKVNLLSSYLPVQWNHVKYIWNNSYLYRGSRWKWSVITLRW